MNTKIGIFAVSILLTSLNLPLHATTAIEQILDFDPGIKFSAPQPDTAIAGFTGLSREEAVAKLPLFDYQKSDVLSVDMSAPVVHKEYLVTTIELIVNDPLRQLGEFKQKFIFYKSSRPGRRPTVLISPPFMPQEIDDLSARCFVEKGYNAVIVVPSESLTDTTRPLDKVDDLLIRNTIMMRMCIDLLETLPEVDSGRIYAYGISMGGIRTALAFGVEPRIKKAGEIVGGGDIPGIIADTKFKLLAKVRDTRMQLEGLATVEDFRVYMKKIMIVDPLDFGVLRNPEDIYFVVSHGDRFVRDQYQEKLFYAFSRPREGRYPRVKRSIVGHLPTAAKFVRYVNIFSDFFGRQ